jgi:hypothetical protein
MKAEITINEIKIKINTAELTDPPSLTMPTSTTLIPSAPTLTNPRQGSSLSTAIPSSWRRIIPKAEKQTQDTEQKERRWALNMKMKNWCASVTVRWLCNEWN